MKPNYGLLISEAFSKFSCYESIKRSYEALSKISLILRNPSELKNRNDLNSPDKFEKLIIKILKEKYYLFDFKKRENYKQEVTSIVKIVYLHKKS